jgi:hypothetical protein
VSERESEPGGPQYGGDRGGASAGSDGGQGGAEGESGERHHNQQGQSGGVGGRGPTERDGELTTEPGKSADSDASRTKSGAQRAQEKQREMEKGGEELPG